MTLSWQKADQFTINKPVIMFLVNKFRRKEECVSYFAVREQCNVDGALDIGANFPMSYNK